MKILTISEHAMLEYLAAVHGISFDELKKQMIPINFRENLDKIDGTGEILCQGFVYEVKDYELISIKKFDRTQPYILKK